MNQTLRVTLVQEELRWQQPEANREHFAARLAGLAGLTDLIILPEMFASGFTMEPQRCAEAPDGASAVWLMQLARQLDCAIVGSQIVCSAAHRHVNRLLFADGTRLLHYDKRHLFRMAGEHQHYSAGDLSLVVNWRGFRIAPLICYDLRFPVWSRRRADYDYDLLLYVANWPAVRRQPWRALLPARAVENQCYVAGVNRVGADGHGVAHSGDSGLWDFAGTALLELGGQPAVATMSISRPALEQFRERFPAHLDADRYTLVP